MNEVRNKRFDEERALYASRDLRVCECVFAGEADGESAMKESKNLVVEGCRFELRYPFWHDENVSVSNCVMTSTCRAPVWYTKNATFSDSQLEGVKAFRECDGIGINNCTVISTELGWNCKNVDITGSELTSEYFLMGSSNVTMRDTKFTGKYSFQYVKNAEIRNCILNTKDAFWHTENVTVYDSVITGEYLAWYSKGLRLVNCKITGTQPFCYAEDLVLENCEMTGCDLAFEYTTVNATVNSVIDSVKNPISGEITALGFGEIILDDHLRDGSNCKITVKK